MSNTINYHAVEVGKTYNHVLSRYERENAYLDAKNDWGGFIGRIIVKGDMVILRHYHNPKICEIGLVKNIFSVNGYTGDVYITAENSFGVLFTRPVKEVRLVSELEDKPNPRKNKKDENKNGNQANKGQSKNKAK